MRYRLASIALLSIIGLLLGPGGSPAQAQPRFVAIDMIKTDLGAQTAGREAPQLIGSSPLLLVVEDVSAWYVRAMTVDPNTGGPLGRTVEFAYPPNPCAPPNPCDLIYSEHFLPGQVIVLGDDGALVAFPISILPDGTPDPGAGVCHPPEPGMADLGPACAMTELPGTAFRDGIPRLYVGTESGTIARFSMAATGEIVLDEVIDLLAGNPIADLGPIPQSAGPLLGVATGLDLYGLLDIEAGASAGLPAVQFVAFHPEGTPVRCFDATPDPSSEDGPVYIVFGDGKRGRIPRATIPPDAAGTFELTMIPPDPVWPFLTGAPKAVVLGSMLVLTDDGQGVYYDPFFDVLTGPSLCVADVNDPEPAVCVECPVTVTGDVNQNSSLTSADIIFLVGFIFKSGAPPEPCEMAGDVNCSGTVNSADIIYLVNHVFKGGPLPCDVCSIWLDFWTSCP